MWLQYLDLSNDAIRDGFTNLAKICRSQFTQTFLLHDNVFVYSTPAPSLRLYQLLKNLVYTPSALMTSIYRMIKL